MLVLKLTCPGVPDIYQGDELEALALVDPDNRRPVDWELRRRLLADDPARDPKLWVTATLLDLRRRRPDAFARGYMPVARATTCARSCAARRFSSWCRCRRTRGRRSR